MCPYPEETDVHNKPIGLNAAVEMLHELQLPYAWVGVADAEDCSTPTCSSWSTTGSAPPEQGSCNAACS